MTEPELGEGWAENKQPVAGDDGVVFYLKYLGFTLVDEVDDDEDEEHSRTSLTTAVPAGFLLHVGLLLKHQLAVLGHHERLPGGRVRHRHVHQCHRQTARVRLR